LAKKRYGLKQKKSKKKAKKVNKFRTVVSEVSSFVDNPVLALKLS